MTYPQVSWEWDEVVPALKAVLPTYNCIRAGREKHQDGGDHLHVYVELLHQITINQPDELDILDHHCNIEAVRRTPWKAYDYAGKEGDIILEEGDPPTKPVKNEDPWMIISQAPDETEFWALVRKHAPKDMITKFNSIKAYADWNYTKSEKYEDPHLAWTPEAKAIAEWWNANADKTRKKTLVIWGDTRLGKTIFSRALAGEHSYTAYLFNLDLISDKTETWIFDDLRDGIADLPCYKMVMGGQKNFNLSDKYRCKKFFTGGKRCIYLANDDPREDKAADQKWLRGNCVFFHVTKPLLHFDDVE